MWQTDPLMVCGTTEECEACRSEPHECPKDGKCKECFKRYKRRKKCKECHQTGFKLTHAMRGLWKGRAAFMVCGGPSLKELPLETLKDRGVASLAINNAGAFAPVKAHTFGDPETKFHSAMMQDPNMISFVPFGKLRKTIQIKHEGRFYPTDIQVHQCPNVWGFSRTSTYDYKDFLTNPSAHWGCKGQPLETQEGKYSKLCTMLLGMRLLHYLGVRRIYMLGVDFHIAPRDSGTPGYAWGDNASSGNRVWDEKIDPMMHELRPVFEQQGVTIYNCNELSNCRAFEYVPFDEALLDVKGPVESEPLDCHEWYNKKLSEAHHKEFGRRLTEEQVASLRYAMSRKGDLVDV